MPLLNAIGAFGLGSVLLNGVICTVSAFLFSLLK